MMLKPGDKAPAFTAQDDAGNTVSLKDFKGKTVVLYFYPKDDTPGCTKEGCDFRDHYKKFQKAGAEILGVSKDALERHAKFKAKFDFPFPLLSDPDGAMCAAYGVWKEKSLYGKTFMGIERSTFVIGPDGKLKDVIRKVKVPGHVEAVLENL